MDFRASLVDLEKGQEIDVFEFTVEKKDVPESERNDYIPPSVFKKGLDLLKKREVTKSDKRVKSYLDKLERASTFANKLLARGENAITEEEFREGERLYEEVYATGVNFDIEPMNL